MTIHRGTEASDSCGTQPQAGPQAGHPPARCLTPTAASEVLSPPPPVGAVTAPGVWVRGGAHPRGHRAERRLLSSPLLPTPASSSQVRVPVPGWRWVVLHRTDSHGATGCASHRRWRSVPITLQSTSCELLSGHPVHLSISPSICLFSAAAGSSQPSGHMTESRPGPGADVSEPTGATALNPGAQPPHRSPRPHPRATPPLWQGALAPGLALRWGCAPCPQPYPPRPRRRRRPGSCPQTYLTNLSTCDMDAS